MGGGGGLPCPFSKIGKKCPNFGKKCPDIGHLLVEFSGEKGRFFSLRDLSSCIVHECLSKCPNFKKSPLPLKIPGYRLVAFIFVGIRNFLLIIPKFQEEIQSS